MGETLDIAIFPGSLSRGGAERVSVRLASYFASRNKRVAIVIAGEKKDDDYDVPFGVDLYCVCGSSHGFVAPLMGYRRFIKTYQPKTILIMGTPLCCTVIPASLFNKSRVIVSERNAPGQFAGKRITKILMRFWMRFADDYVFQTEQAKQYYGAKIKSKGKIIPNPITIDELPERKVPYRKEIVGVGRLNPQKNWPLLIQSFARISPKFPDWELTIYGEGAQRGELEKLIKDLELDGKAFLPGAYDNVLERESSAGIFVMTSDFEGMPNALMEAMAIGLPCISTDCPCGGPLTLIENGKNGILVPVRDEISLSSALESLMRDKKYAARMGENALSVRNKYSLNIIGKCWLDFIEQD